MEIVLDEISREMVHCPYCLQVLDSESDEPEPSEDSVRMREGMRRSVRKRFLSRLEESLPDGKAGCPICGYAFSVCDQSAFLNNDYFQCHFCGHDLAHHAYRSEAFHDQRWLPVVWALIEFQEATDCRDCRWFGAIAKACQKAFSWAPSSHSRAQFLLRRWVRHSTWSQPECDWESCVVVKQYRKLAGKGLLLL